MDSNDNFGSIAIASESTKWTTLPSTKATMENDGSKMGGFLTNYVLVFTTTKYLRPNSWFRLEFPIEYDTFKDIAC